VNLCDHCRRADNDCPEAYPGAWPGINLCVEFLPTGKQAADDVALYHAARIDDPIAGDEHWQALCRVIRSAVA
jgi:hypothetical protein